MSAQRFSYVALERIRPGSKWVCYENDYAKLEWQDALQSKPSYEELFNATQIVIAEVQAELNIEG